MLNEDYNRADGLMCARGDLQIFERMWKMSMMRRAMASYFRQGGNAFPCPYLSKIAQHKGSHYAYLANNSGVLAVYRIRGENSFYRKARRWPKAIEHTPVSRMAMVTYTSMRDAGQIRH